MRRIIVTMDEPPGPPLSAHRRVGIEVIRGLSENFEVEALVYASEEELEVLRTTWSDRPISFHGLSRRRGFRRTRSIWHGLSVPTMTRDFPAEAHWVRHLAQGSTGTHLLINFISGAPLLGLVAGKGVVLSGHDCMSHLHAEEAKYAVGIRQRLHFLLRRWFALNAERRFAHRAEAVHVVSESDARELKLVNPRAVTRVIPLGNEEPDPARLFSWEVRHRRVVWGNLASGPILEGMRQLLAAARQKPKGLFDGWTVVGRIPEQIARQILPELNRHRIEYQVRVDDPTQLLAETRVLLVPDIGGTGQKTRTQDGLSHGCCVVGLPEAFRGLESEIKCPPYILAENPVALVQRLVDLSEHEAARCATLAREFFRARCSRAKLAVEWAKLFNSLGSLAGKS